MSRLGLRREGISTRDIRSDPNQTLAEILAAVQPCDRTRCLLDSVEDVLSIEDLSVAHPALEFAQCLGTALDMVKDEETLHSRAVDEKMTLDPWSLGWRIPACDGRRPADDHPCSDIETSHALQLRGESSSALESSDMQGFFKHGAVAYPALISYPPDSCEVNPSPAKSLRIHREKNL